MCNSHKPYPEGTILNPESITIMKKRMTLTLLALGAGVCANAATLTHRYDFSGDAVNDSVGGGLSGTVNGNMTGNTTSLNAPTFTTTGLPAAGSAIVFDGSSGTKKSGFSLNGLNNDLHAASGSLTMWFNPSAVSGGVYLMNAGLATGFAVLTNKTATIEVPVVKADTDPTPGVQELNYDDGVASGVGQWNHYAITWIKDSDGAGAGTTGTATVYLNEDSYTYTFQSSNWSPVNMNIGNFTLSDNAGNVANQFTGSVYDIQMYDDALSGGEVGFLRDNAGTAIPEPGSYALIGGCLALVLVMLRRRRS